MKAYDAFDSLVLRAMRFANMYAPKGFIVGVQGPDHPKNTEHGKMHKRYRLVGIKDRSTVTLAYSGNSYDVASIAEAIGEAFRSAK